MSYEEQLSAARFRAELERSKRQRMGRTVWRLQNRLSRAHRRERQLRKGLRMWREKAIEKPQVTMSAYELLSEEDREALRWVREHGGLEVLRRMFQDADNRRVELCAALGVDPDMGWSDAMADMRPRLMPEDMEWPRFEDGEPVRIGSDFGYGVKLDSCEVTSILFTSEGCFLEPDYSWEGDDYALRVKQGERVKCPAPKVLDADGVEIREGDTVWFADGSLEDYDPHIAESVNADPGLLRTETIKLKGCSYPFPASSFTHRAPVLAADGRPLREKSIVFDKYTGEKLGVDAVATRDVTCRRLEHGGMVVHYAPEFLTHERPVLDADGVEIRVGDRVWTKAGTGMVVTLVESDKRVVMDGARGGRFVYPAYQLTHRAPVLAADGRPLREGEHVWHVETGTELVVKELPKTEEYQAVVVFALPTSPASHLTSFDPDMLTHESPEIDSWERIEDDAGCTATKYNERRGTTFTTKQQVARDLVRRCRALAERERSE